MTNDQSGLPVLIFATNNPHKVSEMQAAIGHQLNVISLKEAGIAQDIPEPWDTLEANAREKARVIHGLTGQDCFSEDTGLEVAALQGAPGVKSARYAGENANFQENIDKLLRELGNTPHREARFRTVICLIWKGKEYLFEGTCGGRITETASGTAGFGYDPVFQPDGEARTFAEMGQAEKNRISHRTRAAAKLVAFLQEAGNSIDSHY